MDPKNRALLPSAGGMFSCPLNFVFTLCMIFRIHLLNSKKKKKIMFSGKQKHPLLSMSVVKVSILLTVFNLWFYEHI